jgi:hypothetical protein
MRTDWVSEGEAALTIGVGRSRGAFDATNGASDRRIRDGLERMRADLRETEAGRPWPSD